MPQHLADKCISWASILEDKTRDQAVLASTMPFIYPHLALMPDAHLGKGATVGSVIPTLRAIMPAAVGVDIGCGMIAVRTQFYRRDFPDDLRPLREAIEAAIPLSPGKYNVDVTDTAKDRVLDLMTTPGVSTADSLAPNWTRQLGSLGGGNHFIEVSVDLQHRVWLFLHSGSRGVGNKIAVHHIKEAQRLCRDRWIDLPDPDLAYLVEGDRQFTDYIRDLRWAQKFALLNREEMMDRVVGAVEEIVGTVVRDETINCHHNFTEHEKHMGQMVWLSRKGAIDAGVGVRGLIPGSMGTASYVVTGLGNHVSLNSSPHGAGRNYSRSAARKEFNLEQLKESMAGIEWSGSDAFIDEIPMAYKPIDQIMLDAADLVKIDDVLHQILNVKGT